MSEKEIPPALYDPRPAARALERERAIARTEKLARERAMVRGHSRPAKGEVPTYAGASDVARWLGVTRAAVSNWLTRYANCPVPAVRVGYGEKGQYGWLVSQRAEWERWHASSVRPLARNDLSGWQAIADWRAE